jgi:hypothetical protein
LASQIHLQLRWGVARFFQRWQLHYQNQRSVAAHRERSALLSTTHRLMASGAVNDMGSKARALCIWKAAVKAWRELTWVSG